MEMTHLTVKIITADDSEVAESRIREALFSAHYMIDEVIVDIVDDPDADNYFN